MGVRKGPVQGLPDVGGVTSRERHSRLAIYIRMPAPPTVQHPPQCSSEEGGRPDAKVAHPGGRYPWRNCRWNCKPNSHSHIHQGPHQLQRSAAGEHPIDRPRVNRLRSCLDRRQDKLRGILASAVLRGPVCVHGSVIPREQEWKAALVDELYRATPRAAALAMRARPRDRCEVPVLLGTRRARVFYRVLQRVY